MNLLSAFLESLCSLNFYKKVIKEPLSQGFFYLALWSVFASILIGLFLFFRALPAVDEFTGWFKSEMPVITWTAQGISTDKPSPYVMKHPKFGHVATFDMNKNDVPEAEMDEAILFFTATKLYARRVESKETRVYDFRPGKDVQIKEEKIIVDQTVVDKIEKAARPILVGVGTLLSLFGFFIWKLLAVLFYSITGMMLNRTRSEKLTYAQVLNVSFFAVTASLWINFVLFFLSDVARIPFGFPGSFLVTAAYLFLAVKMTEDVQPPIEV